MLRSPTGENPAIVSAILTRGYCSYDVLTSAEEVGFHRTRELGSIGRYEDETRYVELLADVTGIFPDLDAYRDHPALNPNPDIGYPEGQALATDLRRKGHLGLLYPSVRHSDGRCFELSIRD